MNKRTLLLSLVFYLLCQNAAAKKLAELTQNYPLDKGFLGLLYDKQADKLYLKIDNLQQEFIYYPSLPAGLNSSLFGLQKRTISDSRLVFFQRVGNRVLLIQKPTNFRAGNSKQKTATKNVFGNSVLWSFPVVDSGNGWALVDASDFILQDVFGVAENINQSKQGIGYQLAAARSAINLPGTTAFRDNSEIEVVLTFVGKPVGDELAAIASDASSISLKMRHSFVRLPSAGYQPRIYLPKSGYFSLAYDDFSQPINQNLKQRFILRHRLKKKKPAAEKSTAVKPIVYYIDPAMPEAIKSAVIEGAKWWDNAFVAIGYQNAFQVKTLPAGADALDIRYNVIQWAQHATQGRAYSNAVVDPRTGEILKGHIILGALNGRQDYLLAQALLAPFKQNQDDQQLINLVLGRLKQLAAHEVGHTLGLANNFAASSYGNQSVMDNPHANFELQGNQIVAPNAYATGLGSWDKTAIAYGYSDFEKDKESLSLARLIAQNDQKGLLFISDADAVDAGSSNAIASLWDNGSDAVAELNRVIAVREAALKNFGAKNLKHGNPWSDLQDTLIPVYFFHRYQVSAAAKWIGGLQYEYAVKRNNIPAKQKYVSGEKQQQAVTSLLNTLQPDFLVLSPQLVHMLLPKVAGDSGSSINGGSGAAFDPIGLAEASAQHTLAAIFHPHRISRVIQQSADQNHNIPSLDAITTEIHQTVIEQSYEGQQALIHQSVVALVYSNYLNLLYDERSSRQVKMQIYGILLKEKEYLRRKLITIRKTSTYYGFYAYQLRRLENIDVSTQPPQLSLPTVPLDTAI